MLVEIKQLDENNKWQQVPAAELIETSIGKFMMDSSKPVVAAVRDDNDTKKVIMYVSSHNKYVEMMEAKGPSYHISQIARVFGEPPVAALAVKEFENCKFLQFETLSKK